MRGPDGLEERANRLVTRYVLDAFREDGDNQHLRECPDISAENVDAWDGERGCDTGCDFRRFEAVIVCPHGEREQFEWGEFGTMASILEDLERDYPDE